MWAVKLFVVLGIVFLSLTAYSTTEKAPEWIQRLSGAFGQSTTMAFFFAALYSILYCFR